jgi:hypothetical protein
MEAYKIRNTLRQFTGTDQYYKHLFPGKSSILHTEGCKFVKDKCEANWLFDQILLAQAIPRVKSISFQKWIFERLRTDLSWKLTCINTDDNKSVWSKRIEFSDFPLQKIEIWVIDKVALLPSEY